MVGMSLEWIELFGKQLGVYVGPGHGQMCTYLRARNLEDEALRWAAKLAEPGMWVADIGAHVGCYTLLLSGCVGDAGRVFSFEPDFVHASALAAMVVKNDLRNVVTFPAAAGPETGIMPFNQGLCGDAATGIGKHAAWQFRLDEVLPRLDGMKIDTQGGEAGVLLGAARLLPGMAWAMIEHHGDESYIAIMGKYGLALAYQIREKGGRMDVFRRA